MAENNYELHQAIGKGDLQKINELLEYHQSLEKNQWEAERKERMNQLNKGGNKSDNGNENNNNNDKNNNNNKNNNIQYKNPIINPIDLPIEARWLPEHYYINKRDLHGNPPLHLAIHLRNMEIVKFLLERGADIFYTNGGGWNPLQESMAAGDEELIQFIFLKGRERVQKELYLRYPTLVNELKRLPDGYLEISWEFKTWVPLVSRFCPSDTYKIWKKGSKMRIDATLMGYKNLSWLRGDLSIIFPGNLDDPSLYIIDRKKEIMQNSFEKKMEPPSEERIQKLLKQTSKIRKEGFFRSAPDTSKVVMNQRTSFWGNSSKTEKIENFDCTVWDLTNFQLRYSQRKIDSSKETPDKKGLLSLSPTYFETKNQDPRGKGYGMIYENEKVTQREKNFTATVWLSEQYPLTVDQLLPILEVISPTHKHFSKLKQFLELKFPKSGFPLKLDIPILPTLSAIVTFSRFIQKDIEDEIFQVPKFKEEKIQLEFDM